MDYLALLAIAAPLGFSIVAYRRFRSLRRTQQMQQAFQRTPSRSVSFLSDPLD